MEYQAAGISSDHVARTTHNDLCMLHSPNHKLEKGLAEPHYKMEIVHPGLDLNRSREHQ